MTWKTSEKEKEKEKEWAVNSGCQTVKLFSNIFWLLSFDFEYLFINIQYKCSITYIE